MIKARPGRRRPVDRLGVRRRRDAVRLSRGAGAARDRRGPPHQGPPGGVHPAARQGAHRGEARSRRHPRRGVRGAAAADRARPARSAPARSEHAPSARDARRGGLRGAARRRRARRRLSVPAAAGAPAADRARPADPRPARGSARAHSRSRARSAWAMRTRCAPSTSGRRSWSAGSTSGCSTGRCSRRSRDRPAPSPGVDRPATEELLAGLGFESPSQSFEVLRRLVDPATRMGKVLAHVFPVMAPALALGRRTPTRRSSGWSGSPRRWGTGMVRPTRSRRTPSAAQRLAHRRRRQLVRDRSAGRRSGADDGARRRRRGRSTRRPRWSSAVGRYASRELQPRETGVRRSPTSPTAWCARRWRPPSPICRSR